MTPQRNPAFNDDYLRAAGQSGMRPKIGDLPGMQEAARRVKYPEAYTPGQPNITHGFDPSVNPGSRGPAPYQYNLTEVTGPFSKVPPRGTVDAGKGMVPAASRAITPVSDVTMNSGRFDRVGPRPTIQPEAVAPPPPSANIVPAGPLNSGSKVNWTFGGAEAPAYSWESQAAQEATTKMPSIGGMARTAGRALSGVGAVAGIAETASEQSGRDAVLARMAARGNQQAIDVMNTGGTNPLREVVARPVREFFRGDSVPEYTQVQFAAGTKLPGGGSVADKFPAIDFSNPSINTAVNSVSEAKEFPAIDFSNPSINAVAKPAQPGWGRQVDINNVRSGEGVMRNDAGTYGYRQMPNGDLVKFDAQGNQVGTLGNVAPRQQAGGMRMTSYGAMTPVDNPLAYETERRMAERAAAAEEAKLARLEELAMTGGGGDGTFTGMGNQKRIRRGAQAALSERMGMQRAKMADASQRATQQMQNETTMRGQDIQRDIADATNQRAEAKAEQDARIEMDKLASTEAYNKGMLSARNREVARLDEKQTMFNVALAAEMQRLREEAAGFFSEPPSEDAIKAKAYYNLTRTSGRTEG